ncbi:MAG: hypothetical protein HQ538_05200 [Parcubacteria group bacterium]|nr:hypothetical protein [Parcubacteria group bacterium]
MQETLVPGTVNEDDPTRIGDGNELGVYMSTNPHMVEAAYAKGGGGRTHIDVPEYHDGRTIVDRITLPSCGIMVEVDTNELKIRPPKIISSLQGVYNNGFEGDEWIADEIPSEHYKPVKLILSRWANDNQAFQLTIDDQSPEGLQSAIETIKEEFAQRQAAALEYKQFLESLNDKQRQNHFLIKSRWKK